MFAPDLIDKSFTDALDGLALQLSAGVQLDKALRSAGGINRTPAGRQAFDLAQERVKNGEPFERALDAMAVMISYPERAMLAAGWHSGKFDDAIARVVKRRELMHATRSEIRRQMILPGIVLFAAAFIAPLPPLLLGYIGMGGYLGRALPPILIAVGLWVAVRMMQQAAARRWTDWLGDADAPESAPPATQIDHALLTIPGARDVERKRNLSEFALLMSNLISAGMPMIESLRTTARALPNGVYRHETLRIAEQVKVGTPISQSMRAGVSVGGGVGVDLWPHEWAETMEVAESAGEQDVVLGRLGEAMRERYIETVRAWGRWIPRVVYALVSAWVVMQILAMWGALPRGV